MLKLAYALGAQRACECLGLKVAALTPGIAQAAKGRTSATPSKAPFWGLGGNVPQGFTGQDPASIQAGAQPGGPPQLDAAPKATPPTQPAPSPGAATPLANPTVKLPGATGITAPLEAKAVPGAGGSPAAAPKSTATRTGTDVSDVAARTGSSPF
jgi:hypothetical protein